MATFILLPDGVTGTNEWLAKAGGACASTNIDNDDDDTDYCEEDTHSHEITFTMANSSVAAEDIASITSVQIKFKAKHTTSGTSYVDIYQTGTDISNGYTRVGVTDTSDYGAYSADAEFTFDGATSWGADLTQINNLQVKLDKFRNPRFSDLRISYLYAQVEYQELGYTNNVMGVDSGNISKVNGIAITNISKVNGV